MYYCVSKFCNIDLINFRVKKEAPELEISHYGLDESATVSLDGLVHGENFQGKTKAPVRDVLSFLKETYTQHIGYEWMHIEV